MKLDTDFKLQDYLGHKFECDCGKVHSTKLEAVEIGKDALLALPTYLKKYGFKYPFVVCDRVTYIIAGIKLVEILTKNQIAVRDHIFITNKFAPDEKAVGELLVNMPKDCDVVIAVGTGSINDLVRFFSFKTDRPFITVATAAPMDGFASSVAALNINNYKKTFETQVPKTIIGDTEILKGAPISMTIAGLADILGKFTCLCDWKLSKLINGEYYCDQINEMVHKSIREVYKYAPKVNERDPEAIGKVMEALVLTGVAMSFVGNSRPAAGSEHHLSHYWEMLFAERGLTPVLHGAKVGIGTILILKIAELLIQHSVDFQAARKKANEYDEKKWTEHIKRAYGIAADGIIALEHESQKNSPKGILKRIDIIEAKWDEICEILENNLPPAQEIKELLKKLDAPYSPSQIGVDNQMLHDAIVYGKDTRARYTILQLVWDLGLSEDMAGCLVEYINSEDHTFEV